MACRAKDMLIPFTQSSPLNRSGGTDSSEEEARNASNSSRRYDFFEVSSPSTIAVVL